jgi:hypothetical protein
MGSSVSMPVMNPGAMGIYNQQLGLQLQNYSNILNGYSQAQNNIGRRVDQIAGGYDAAQRNVMNTLGVGNGGWGVAAPAAKEIQQSFLDTQGKNQQALISAGLGNSSLLAQSNNQANKMAGQAYASLGSQLATTAAGYQSQFALARQAAEMQGLGMQTNLSQSYLGNLAGYNFMPKVDLYGQYSAHNDGSGGGGGGGGSMAGGRPSNWAPSSGFGDDAWANRYGAPNNLGYAGAYTNGSAYSQPAMGYAAPGGGGLAYSDTATDDYYGVDV